MIDFRPWYLIVKTPDDAFSGALAAYCTSARGDVVVGAGKAAVETLEHGTVHTAMLIARFAFEADLNSAWSSIAPELPHGAQALAAPGLPYEGWPGHAVPTIATVNVPDGATPRAYMLIEGTGTDEGRMDAYRDVILPMIRERGGYYTLFELGGSVKVLAGEWTEAILAISRWPTIAAARDFWFSERYQNVAIPIRKGFGHFEVQLAEGLSG
jgi:uncharacterized protein (DUF1330 family)